MKRIILISLLILVQNILFSQNEKNKLSSLYLSFEDDIKNNKVEHFKTLFYNNDVPLNTVIRTNDSLQPLSFLFSDWLNFLSTKTFSYETRISNAEYHIDNQVAYSVATFDEFAKDEQVSIGTDLFLYIKNKNKWLLASLNGSATLTANTKIKDFPILCKKDIKNSIKNSLNNKTYSSLFNTHFSVFSRIYYTDDAQWKSQTLTDYFKEKKISNESWKPKNLNIRIIDKHMAIVKLKIKITKGAVKRTAQAYISLLATNENVPVITSIILAN